MGFLSTQYHPLGFHMTERYIPEEIQRSMWKHKIPLYEPSNKINDAKVLLSIIHCEKHSFIDFQYNMEDMINCLTRNIDCEGNSFYAVSQRIRFTVYKGQEKPFTLPLISFIFNYTLIMPQIFLGVDMSDWRPWNPAKFSNSAMMEAYDELIYRCRENHRHRDICDMLSESKYWLNILCYKIGDHLGYSISNAEFVEVAKRNKEAKKTLTCTFDIPKKLIPSELEKLRSQRARDLMNYISSCRDLCISSYTNAGLFNTMQFAELACHIGFKPDLIGNTIPMTSNTNIFMGNNTPQAYYIDSCGGRKAEAIKKKVSDAGQLLRSLSFMMDAIKYVDPDPSHDCGSQHFRERYIKSVADLDKLDGRVYTLDPRSNKFKIIHPQKPDKSLIGKKIYLKTPITCTHPLRHKGVICSACYGKLLAMINQDVHIGKLSALNNANDMEQKLLSAKHALNTNTTEPDFSDNFNAYFKLGNCAIAFSDDLKQSVSVDPQLYENLYLEFDIASIKKHSDGQGHHFDYSIEQITIYDRETDHRELIEDKNGITLFMSPYIAETYYEPGVLTSNDGTVKVSLVELINDLNCPGMDQYQSIFEFQFKNFEIADPLSEIDTILNNGTDDKGINRFKSYNELLDYCIPMFEKGGIHIPEIHIEMMVACMIDPIDMTKHQMVNWKKKHPRYRFCSITTAILKNRSVISSMLYGYTNTQIDGAYDTYNKTGTSPYDCFIGNSGNI